MGTLSERLADLCRRAGVSSLPEATAYHAGVANALEAVQEFCYGNTGKANSFTAEGRSYYYEWPDAGETGDGSVSAEVYERVGKTSVLVGRYEIDGRGRIVAFPGLPKHVINRINAGVVP